VFSCLNVVIWFIDTLSIAYLDNDTEIGVGMLNRYISWSTDRSVKFKNPPQHGTFLMCVLERISFLNMIIWLQWLKERRHNTRSTAIFQVTPVSRHWNVSIWDVIGAKAWWRCWWQLELQRQCPSCWRPNSVKALKGKCINVPRICSPQAHLGVFRPCLWPLKAPGYLVTVRCQ